MTIQSVEKSFCTTGDAARLLGVSVATVQSWSESGLLHAWKTAGGHRRILRESVERLLYKSALSADLPAKPPPQPLAKPVIQTVPRKRLRVGNPG